MEKASDMDNVKNIVQWARDRNLIDGATKHAQMLKLTEEVRELAAAIARNKYDDAFDAIGDCTVVLIILAAQMHVDFEYCLHLAWEQIMDRKGKMVNGVFVKEGE